MTLGWALELVAGGIAEHRQELPVAEERAVGHHQVVLVLVGPGTVVDPHDKAEIEPRTHRQGLRQLGDIEAEGVVAHHAPMVADVELDQLDPTVDRQGPFDPARR